MHTLHKATNYSIRVLAYTATGDGIASQPLYCQTEDDVPDAPASIKAAALTADSILISWLPPRNRNGIITHYTVYSREAGRKGQAKCKYDFNFTTKIGKKNYFFFLFFYGYSETKKKPIKKNRSEEKKRKKERKK